jgi:hypothetical protein
MSYMKKKNTDMPKAPYPLPEILVGKTTVAVYDAWLEERASTLFHRNKKRKRPVLPS